MVAQDKDLDDAYDCNKLKQSLTSNFYAILSPQPCQVKEQEIPDTQVKKGKGSIIFRLPPNHQHDNKMPMSNHSIMMTMHFAAESLMDPFLQRQPTAVPHQVLGPKRIANTSSTPDTGKQSNKIFRMPNGATESATNIGHLAMAIQSPVHDIHITPRVNETSLISTVTFAKASYVMIFDHDEVNIYNQCDTSITMS